MKGTAPFAAASHVIHYNRVTLYEGDISDLTPLRGVVFETDEIIIVGTLLTTTDGMDSARIGDSVRIVGAENLLVVEGFEASPSVAVGLAGLPSLQRVDLPTNTGPNSHWPNGNLCTIILPMMPGTPEYCERVRTEVPMCGTPEDPQPAVLVTGCPP